MAKERTSASHPTELIYDCKQENRLMVIEAGINTMVDKVDSMCESVDDLTHKFNDAMFPSDMHPENGLINGYHNNKKHIIELQEKVLAYENAQIIPNLDAVKKEISKFKTWITAIVSIAVVAYTVITYIIDTYMKTK